MSGGAVDPADHESAVRAAFRGQAEACAKLGSPFTARLCAILADGLDHATLVGRTVLEWRGDPDAFHDNVPLRLAGGLHALVRRGHLPDLAALYPPRAEASDGRLPAVLLAAIGTGDEELAAWLASPPQTNEVARSAVLMAGYAVVTARTGLPLALLELGVSAGLNLLADRWRCDLGGRLYGDPASPVRLVPAWTGEPPPAAAIRVAIRRGVDLNPLDVGQAQDRERLLAYIWPDQAERLARTEAAIAVARAFPPPIDRGEASVWLERRLTERPDGIATVVAHSIALQYFPAALRARIAALIEEAGAGATPERPLAWLRYEADPDFGGRASLRLRLWPGGDDELLALAHPHALWINWRAPSG